MTTSHKVPGRPRSFDRDAALAAALELFWSRGYEGVELRDLTAAMNIHPPSFYAAFGNKRAAFTEALDLYEALYGRPIAAALRVEPTARAAVQAFLELSVKTFTRPKQARGCFLTVGAANCTLANDDVAAELAARRQRSLNEITDRLKRGRDDGDLPTGIDVKELACYVATVAAGLSTQARDGVSRKRLCAIASRAATAIPEEACT